jgi:hypothetical protein
MPDPESYLAAETRQVVETEAADGGQRYGAVTTLTDLINMLSDGQFNYDCAEEIKRLSEQMEVLGCDTGDTVKGSITVKIDITRKQDGGGIYFFAPDLKVALPKTKRRSTLGFVTEDNRFTPNKPRQGNMFGNIRDVNAEPRNVRN